MVNTLIAQILFNWVARYLPFDHKTNGEILIQLAPAMQETT
jgi:hypothetical protein